MFRGYIPCHQEKKRDLLSFCQPLTFIMKPVLGEGRKPKQSSKKFFYTLRFSIKINPDILYIKSTITTFTEKCYLE